MPSMRVPRGTVRTAGSALDAGPALDAGSSRGAGSALDAGEDLVRDVEIGRDPLDVVMLLERLHELQGLLRVLFGERDRALGHLADLGRGDGDAFSLDRLLHRLELVRRRRDLVPFWLHRPRVL